MALAYTPVGLPPESTGTRTRTSDLSFFVVGLNHKTAPVEVRERLSVPEQKLPGIVQSVARLPMVGGASVVSTCNRVEVIVSSASETAVDSVVEWMADHAGSHRHELAPHLYVHRRLAGLEHLFRVASGLDSMIIGEPQITGQLKKAFTVSQTAGTLDSLLRRVFETTMRVAKKVRTETRIGEHAVSVPYASIELAKKIFGDLSGLRVLLLGAGEMGELTAEHLAAHSVEQIFVANKTFDRAVDLARRFKGTAVQFDALEEHLAECDIVIVSTAAPHFVIDRNQVQRALAARKLRRLFLVDLSVPRNIDPAIAELDSAFLYNIDDLEQLTTANLALRHQKLAQAEEIIAGQVETFRRRLLTQDAVPAIVELHSHLDQIRAAELDTCLRTLGPISTELKEAIEQLSLQMVNKILHHPMVHLKESAKAPPEQRESLRLTFRAIFGLP